PSGIHTVSVSATDPNLQETDSPTALLKIDRVPPRVSIAVHGSRVVVHVRDGQRRQVAGVTPGATTVRWGDRHRSLGTGRLSHRYAKRRRRYKITVSAFDNAGNAVHVTRRVRA